MKESEPIKKPEKNQNDGYFDDCPICQAMKKAGVKMEKVCEEEGEEAAENDFYAAKIEPQKLEKLKAAFVKAKEQGAVVGGEWFEEKDDKKARQK